MEAAPVAVEARSTVHHSARSYVPGGGNDPRAVNAGTSNVNKREDEAETGSTWRRERPKDSMPRHVRDAISRKRDASKDSKPVEARNPDPAPRGDGQPQAEPPKARSEPGKSKVEARNHHQGTPQDGSKPRAVNPSDIKVEVREDNQPRADKPSEDLSARKTEERSDASSSAPEARHEGHDHGHEHIPRGPIRPIAVFKRTLASLD